MEIQASNGQGRAWGINAIASILSGGEGLLTGIEVDVKNYGCDEPTVDTIRNKTGILIVSQGSHSCTCAIAVRSTANSKWHKVLYTTSGDLETGTTDSVLEILDWFTLRRFTSDSSIRFEVGSLATGGLIFTGGNVIMGNGAVFKPRFANQATQPSMGAGELMIWGDTSTGTTYLVFHNGAAPLKVALT